MKRLNIFVDETGDFGFDNGSSALYGVSFTFHDQSNDITLEINNLNDRLKRIGYTGMIHISELDTAFVNDIGKYVTNKEEIFAKIMSIDEKNKHVNLSVKCMNYRNTSDFDETISGFRPLYEKLPRWMDDEF